MRGRPAARLAFHDPAVSPVRGTHSPSSSPLLVASVERTTPQLEGIDWVRIDGANGPIEASALRRSFAPLPAMFDVPGPHTQRRSLLTPTEYLVFAAAEGFEWVNLRGVRTLAEVERAREFLAPATKLSASIHSSEDLRRSLEMLGKTCDAVLLHAGDLERQLGARGTRRALRAALRHLEAEGTPALLVSELWATAPPGHRPGAATDRIDRQLRAGYRGLVLAPEILHADDPQGSVDVARTLVDRARVSGSGGNAGGARIR